MVVWLWIGFIVFVLVMLALDLGVFNRKAHVIRTREALAWTSLCIVLALIFNGLIYFMYKYHWLGIGTGEGAMTGSDAALKFFTGWVIEYSLSLDNIFVIAVIFSYFGVPPKYQHRVLFWGILGALIMRGLMIWAGKELIERFEWTMYVFGGLLIFTAIKMLLTQTDEVEPEKNPLVRLARRLYPVTSDFHEQKFFAYIDGKKAITPMFLVLLVVESTDVLFAIDSIPAIFAITQDTFLVFTSNVFAILGLRSLYFALAGMMGHFRYLKASLVFVLAFVGVKMILTDHYHIDTMVSLAVIVSILGVGIVASLFGKKEPPPCPPSEP